jgi:hypothetical protein
VGQNAALCYGVKLRGRHPAGHREVEAVTRGDMAVRLQVCASFSEGHLRKAAAGAALAKK